MDKLESARVSKAYPRRPVFVDYSGLTPRQQAKLVRAMRWRANVRRFINWVLRRKPKPIPKQYLGMSALNRCIGPVRIYSHSDSEVDYLFAKLMREPEATEFQMIEVKGQTK